MERKLLSGNGLKAKLFLAFISIFFSAMLVVSYQSPGGRSVFPVVSVVILPLIGYLYWLVFSQAHPVYFDDNFLYLNKSEIEEKVPFSKIGNLLVRISGIGWRSKLDYYDEDNEYKEVSFFIHSSGWGSENEILQELKELVQRQNPAFKIIWKRSLKDIEL